jgi:hypothetical protein
MVAMVSQYVSSIGRIVSTLLKSSLRSFPRIIKFMKCSCNIDQAKEKKYVSGDPTDPNDIH